MRKDFVDVPSAEMRKITVIGKWLLSLDKDEVLVRMRMSGKMGFYEHERQFLSEFYDNEIIKRRLRSKKKPGQATGGVYKPVSLEPARNSLDLCAYLVEAPDPKVRKAAEYASRLYLRPLGTSEAMTTNDALIKAGNYYNIDPITIIKYINGAGMRTVDCNADVDQKMLDGLREMLHV